MVEKWVMLRVRESTRDQLWTLLDQIQQAFGGTRRKVWWTTEYLTVDQLVKELVRRYREHQRRSRESKGRSGRSGYRVASQDGMPFAEGVVYNPPAAADGDQVEHQVELIEQVIDLSGPELVELRRRALEGMMTKDQKPE